jgi:hypothetical protein
LVADCQSKKTAQSVCRMVMGSAAWPWEAGARSRRSQERRPSSAPLAMAGMRWRQMPAWRLAQGTRAVAGLEAAVPGCRDGIWPMPSSLPGCHRVAGAMRPRSASDPGSGRPTRAAARIRQGQSARNWATAISEKVMVEPSLDKVSTRMKQLQQDTPLVLILRATVRA